jgi:hypothetical protein
VDKIVAFAAMLNPGHEKKCPLILGGLSKSEKLSLPESPESLKGIYFEHFEQLLLTMEDSLNKKSMDEAFKQHILLSVFSMFPANTLGESLHNSLKILTYLRMNSYNIFPCRE